jgi:hypothetical protein
MIDVGGMEVDLDWRNDGGDRLDGWLVDGVDNNGLVWRRRTWWMEEG